MPTKRKHEMFVADYRDYSLTVYGCGDEWEYWIHEGKWKLLRPVKIKGSRRTAQQAAGEHLVNFLSRTEQMRYKVDDLHWRDWMQETAAFGAEIKDWLAGRRPMPRRRAL